MQLVCAHCRRVLDFAGERPRFCAYCGKALADARLLTPNDVDPHASTQPAVAASDDKPSEMPQHVGGYRLLRELGAGGMGAVFEAEESATGRRVALKLIAPSFTGSDDTVERFRQEGRIASMIAHPRCVFVLAVDEQAGQPYIVMELMVGATLKDLVEKDGPLRPEEAIAKILDVIDGLQEAHRLNVIHRDVKPSNCFLESDSRVKVGDFGLAKSLVKESHLTQTGAFVGTPHFASPEQVRGDALDPQTDVYSVSATLYFLLTGAPPFWGSDPAATLARIVSDPAPSMRVLRPELSPALDRVVLRGLERDRSKRWPDLEALRLALSALIPQPLSVGGLGRRLVAFLIDVVLLSYLVNALAFGLLAIPAIASTASRQVLEPALQRGGMLLVFLIYFSVGDARWGCTLGKRLFRLRVCSTKWIDPPSWGQALVRATGCYTLLYGGSLVAALTVLAMAPESQITGGLRLVHLFLPPVWFALGLLALVATMRSRSSYRGLHETLSGTRVALLPEPVQRAALQGTGGWLLSFLGSRRLDQNVAPAGGLPERLAGFSVRGVLKWTPDDKILLGEDATLGRRVFLWLRPQTAALLDRPRRDIGRRTRLRWLASGIQGDQQWDAILAPSGCPLPEFIRSEGTLSWTETRPLLLELSGELRAACADGTLPGPLTAPQVWVQADGRVQLADTPLTTAEVNQIAEGSDNQRALALLRDVAVVALDGPQAPWQKTQTTVSASLPPNVRVVIDRLFDVAGSPYQSVEQFEAALIAAVD